MLKSGLHKTSSLLTVAVLVFSLSTSLSRMKKARGPTAVIYVLETKDGVFLNIKYYRYEGKGFNSNHHAS